MIEANYPASLQGNIVLDSLKNLKALFICGHL